MQVRERARTAFEDVGKHNQLHTGYLRVHILPQREKREWLPKVWLCPEDSFSACFVFFIEWNGVEVRAGETSATPLQRTKIVDKSRCWMHLTLLSLFCADGFPLPTRTGKEGYLNLARSEGREIELVTKQ